MTVNGVTVVTGLLLRLQASGVALEVSSGVADAIRGDLAEQVIVTDSN